MQIKSKKIRDAVASCITGLFSGLNRIIPKNKKQILFYTNTGIKDNLKAVMDYIAADADFSDYRLICSCDSTAGLPKGFTAISNLRGLITFLRSGYVFYYNGKIPIKPSASQTVVNLWHGIPLKKIGRMLDANQKLDFSTHYLAPSSYTGILMQKAFGCSADKILINGLPRCDLLFDAPSAKEACEMLGVKDCNTLIGFLPTFRNADVSDITDSDLSAYSKTGLPLLHDANALSRCNAILKEHHALLWVKLHPNEANIPDNGVYSNILIQTDAQFLSLHTDLYRLLGSCDALLTDYSSVYFDYLLLNRPIGFAIEDISSYSRNRGFTAENPIAEMPGSILQTEDHLVQWLDDIFTQNDGYADKRQEILSRYCGTPDKQATMHLLQKIGLKGN